MTTMEDLFRSYWWLIFPVGWLLYAAFQSLLKYNQQKAMMDLIRTYAEKGAEPPEALIRQLDRPLNLDGEDPAVRRAAQSPAHHWSLVGLFSVMAAGFGGAAVYMGYWPFGIVAMTFTAVAVWALIMALYQGRSRS